MATSLWQRGRLVPAIAIALMCAPVVARATVIPCASSAELQGVSATESSTASDDFLDADVSSLANDPETGELIQTALEESTEVLELSAAVASSLLLSDAELVGDLPIDESPQTAEDESPGIFGPGSTLMTAPISSLMPGDADGDGTCNQVDMDIVLANYNQSGKFLEDGDFNGDGWVNGCDFNIVLSNFNQSLPVPEPSALALLLSGCMVFGLNTAIHRTRRRKL